MSAKSIGPYKIEKRLGVGGMGEVFKAFDERLGRWVAIKRIRPDKEGAGDNRERLRREARAVAQLNHSAIVQVYDIFQDGQSDCIVMEFVEGQTLDVLLKEGSLDPLRAAVLGHEIAEGLSEAHSKKVIHRDLKTENIIVTPSGRAKILDFGLAKPISADGLDPVLTGKGQLVGTSRAMSPEYVGGGDVDARADLFSLGVLLYESVAGKSPFRAQNTLATLKQVILHRQTPVSELNPSVPQELSDLIDALLEKEPDNRPPTAEVVAADLGRIAGQLSSGTIDLPSSTLRSSGSGSRPVFASPSGTTSGTLSGNLSATATLEIPRQPSRAPIWALAAAILVAAVGIFLFLQREATETPDGSKESKQIWIVVGDFFNRTGEPKYDESLAAAFRNGLELSTFARVKPQKSIDDTIRRMELSEDTKLDNEQWIELARREEAAHLALGEILKIGERYSMIGRVIDPRSGEVLLTAKAEPKVEDEMLDALNQITDEIRAWLGESGSDIESTQRLDKVTTKNIDALDAYTRANPLDPSIAIPLLHKAITLDPEFAMAHAKLGAIYRNEDQESKAVFHFNQALVNSDRLSDIERYYVRGWKAYSDRDQDEMIESWSLLSTYYPDNPESFLNLGASYYLIQLYENAVDAYEQAAETAKNQEEHGDILLVSLRTRAFALIAINRFEEALASVQDMEPRFAFEPTFYVHLAQHDLTAALELLEQSPASGEQAGAALRDEILYLESDQGHFASALSHRGIPIPQTRRPRALEDKIDWLLDRVALLELSGELQALKETAALTLKTVRESSEPSEISSVVPDLALIGKLIARRGLVSEATKIHELIKAPAEESFDLWRSQWILLEAEIRAANGNLNAAIDLAEEALGAADSFEAHETLGRFKALSGDLDAAEFHYRWIHQRRGRALVEMMGSVPRRLITWNVGVFELAKLREQKGDFVQADQLYGDFLDRWNDPALSGEALLLVEEAKKRKEALAEKLPPAIASVS